MSKGYVYILEDQEGKYYIGSTTDVQRRFYQHQHGHTQTTKKMKNVKLILAQEYNSLEDARRIELKLKRLKRKDYIAKIIADGIIKITVN